MWTDTKSKRIENSIKILNLLKQHEYLSISQIKEKLNIDKGNRTIYRYIDTLKRYGYKFESIIDNKKGYKLIRPNKLTYEEMCYLGQTISAEKIEIFKKIQILNDML